MTVTTGTPPGHPGTRVAYTEASGLHGVELDIQGELLPSSVPNVAYAVSVDIGNTVTSIGREAFRSCAYMEDVQLPSSVTAIGQQAFCGCSRLASVSLPDSVTDIGIGAFSDCTSLCDVEMGDGVMHVGWNAFLNCPEELFDTDRIPGLKVVGDWVVEANGNFPSHMSMTGLRGIGDQVFAIHRSYFAVTSDTPLIVGDEAFVESSIMAFYAGPGSRVGGYSFYRCISLYDVTMSSIAYIGDDAFYGCSSLGGNVRDISSGIEYIGPNAFGGVEGMKLAFHGMTISQVRGMDNYPWGVASPDANITVE